MKSPQPGSGCWNYRMALTGPEGMKRQPSLSPLWLQKNSVKHYLISSLSLHLAWDSQCHSEQTLRPWSYLTTPTCGPFNIGNSAKCQNQHPARKRTVTTINSRSPLFPIGVYLWDVLCHTQVRPLHFVVSPKGILKLRIFSPSFSSYNTDEKYSRTPFGQSYFSSNTWHEMMIGIHGTLGLI